MRIALITARGGSTRIPRKNLIPICGLPLFAWSIIQAKCSKLIDKVYLTTDDDEIAEVGMKYGAHVIRRPVMDNGVTAGVPFRMALEEIERMHSVDSIVCMLPTSVLKFPNDIDGLCRAFDIREKGVTDVGTAAPVKECFFYKNDKPYWDRFRLTESEPVFYARIALADKFWNYSRMMGGWSCATRDFLYKTWSTNPDMDIDIDTTPIPMIPPRVALYAVQEWQCTDIDYPEDAKIADLFMEHFILKGRGPEVYYEYWRNHG